MNSTTKFLLSIEQPLCDQLVENALSQYPDVEIVGHTHNLLETLAIIAQAKPHVWLHSWPDDAEYRAILTHVQSVAPSLVIVHFDPENPCSYLQVPVHSVNELVHLATRLTENVEPALSTHH